MRMEQFVRINAPAAAAASRALTQLAHRPAEIKLTHAEFVELSAEPASFDREEVVDGIYFAISGGLEGAALLCFPEQKAFDLSAILLGKASVRSAKLSELGESALMEVGNIICGNYLTELSNVLRLKVVPGVPHFARGMFGSMLEQVVARSSADPQTALLIDVELDLPAGSLLGHLLLYFKTGPLIDA
jgi:chemotaxis protein CheC